MPIIDIQSARIWLLSSMKTHTHTYWGHDMGALFVELTLCGGIHSLKSGSNTVIRSYDVLCVVRLNELVNNQSIYGYF